MTPAASANRVHLVGFLWADPVIWKLGDELTVHLVIGTSGGWQDDPETRPDRTMWNQVMVRGLSAQYCLRYALKGSFLSVEGRMVPVNSIRRGVRYETVLTHAHRVQILRDPRAISNDTLRAMGHVIPTKRQRRRAERERLKAEAEKAKQDPS